MEIAKRYSIAYKGLKNGHHEFDFKADDAFFEAMANEDIKGASVTVTVRGFTGGNYLLWDAFENKAVRRHSSDGRIPMELLPNNLLVLILGSDVEANATRLACEIAEGDTELTADWLIEICREGDLPRYTPYKTARVLVNMTAPDEMPRFTGNMRYTATVTLDPNTQKILDLGLVGQTAEVRLNGKHIGTRLFAPYRFDISEAAVAGKNVLEITVTNTCVYEQRDEFSRYMLVKPSGLLGPIRLGS